MRLRFGGGRSTHHGGSSALSPLRLSRRTGGRMAAICRPAARRPLSRPAARLPWPAMNAEAFNAYCASLPATTHVVQWGGADVWKVGGKVFALGRQGDGQIGRESCRERVCPYGYISVVGVA